MHRMLAASAVLFALSAPAFASMEEVAVIETPQGSIVWRFFDDAAPKHAAYVRELIGRGFYDGTTFHRVIPHFVIQGGDPLSKNDDRADDGEGEAERRLSAEFSTTLHYRPGTVGMARDADPDSGSCQFFIALESLPRLDGRYTVFGEVIEGLEVARRIAELPRDGKDNPLERVKIRARLERREVPAAIVSREAGAAGEVLTGPDKPRFYDPGNVLWSAPRPSSTPGSQAPPSTVRLDLAIDGEGRVLDVRFPDPQTDNAAGLRKAALDWRFEPAAYDGTPQKVRFEIGADGSAVGPSMTGGAPVAIDASLLPPAPAVRVELPAGARRPAEPPRLRLTVDAEGGVTEAALQKSCGDAQLDRAALEAARRMVFVPARRADGRPASVYIDVEGRFVEGGT